MVSVPVRALIVISVVSACALCQGARIDFSGTWRVISNSKGHDGGLTEIKQEETTISLRTMLASGEKTEWIVYPTNGDVTVRKRWGHMATRRSGRWTEDQLTLETSGEGSAPWRRSTTTQNLSLSGRGTVLKMGFRFKQRELDYEIVLEKVSK